VRPSLGNSLHQQARTRPVAAGQLGPQRGTDEALEEAQQARHQGARDALGRVALIPLALWADVETGWGGGVESGAKARDAGATHPAKAPHVRQHRGPPQEHQTILKRPHLALHVVEEVGGLEEGPRQQVARRKQVGEELERGQQLAQALACSILLQLLRRLAAVLVAAWRRRRCSKQWWSVRRGRLLASPGRHQCVTTWQPWLSSPDRHSNQPQRQHHLGAGEVQVALLQRQSGVDSSAA